MFWFLTLALVNLKLGFWVLDFICGWFCLNFLLAPYFCLYIPQFVQHLNNFLFIFLVVGLKLLIRICCMKLWILRTENWFHRLVFVMIFLIRCWYLICLHVFGLLSCGCAMIFFFMITLFVLELDSEGTDKFGHFPVVFLYFSQVRKNTVQFSQSFIHKFFTVFMLNC